MNYLSKKGYVVIKDNHPESLLNSLKKELVARPLVDKKYGKVIEYPVYKETKNKIYIPKMFGLKKFGEPPKFSDNYYGKNLNECISFKGSLLEHQIEPVNSLLNSCKEYKGGILELNTGFGKTVCALYALISLGKKTLIVVNKIPLLNQWIEEIKQFIPNASIGIIQGQKINEQSIQNADIILCMLQSMAVIEYPDNILNNIGTCIIDEIHNLSSKTFSQVLFKVCSQYTIGLSATPRRADGCEYVYKWHIGDIVYSSTSERKGKEVIVNFIKLKSENYKEISTTNFMGQKQIQFTSMISELITMPERNSYIIELIADILEKDPNRKLLVLSDRRSHLDTLKAELSKKIQPHFTYGLFVGGMKKQDLDNSRKCKIILATFSAFKEGVSEKDLDTLILTTPKKFVGHIKNSVKKEGGNMEQIVGRIFRKEHTERHPEIYDLMDHFSVFKNQANSRKVFYKEHFTNGIFNEVSRDLS